MASCKQRPDGKWRARYRDDDGKEHAKHFRTKKEGEAWLARQTVGLLDGTHVNPKDAKTTFQEWSDEWIKGYSTNRPGTVRQAKVHLQRINAQFGNVALKDIRPSAVKSWLTALKSEGLSDSYIHAVHNRLAQVLTDAVHDGLIPKAPTSRRTTPKMGKKIPYVATTEQVWALHKAMPDGMKNVVLLGAFAGLRVGEIAALRVQDVDALKGVIHPAIQYPNEPLKTDESKNPIFIPRSLAFELNKNPVKWGAETFVTLENGRPAAPVTIEQYWRNCRDQVEGLPEGFRIHDLRHYFASLLISKGLDVMLVQSQLRHASASTTLNIYGHLWPDKDESAREAVADVIEANADYLRTVG